MLATAVACSPGPSFPNGGAEPSSTIPGIVLAEAFADLVIVQRAPPKQRRVEAVPSTVALAPGETTLVKALAYDESGHQLTDATFRWTAQSAGAISSSGVFRSGVQKGTFPQALSVEARSPSVPGVFRTTVNVVIIEAASTRQAARVRVLPTHIDVVP